MVLSHSISEYSLLNCEKPQPSSGVICQNKKRACEKSFVVDYTENFNTLPEHVVPI